MTAGPSSAAVPMMQYGLVGQTGMQGIPHLMPVRCLLCAIIIWFEIDCCIYCSGGAHCQHNVLMCRLSIPTNMH